MLGLQVAQAILFLAAGFMEARGANYAGYVFAAGAGLLSCVAVWMWRR